VPVKGALRFDVPDDRICGGSGRGKPSPNQTVRIWHCPCARARERPQGC